MIKCTDIPTFIQCQMEQNTSKWIIFTNIYFRIADSSLIRGQRMSEWCSKGPTLEEDIAMSNIGLDLIWSSKWFL